MYKRIPPTKGPYMGLHVQGDISTPQARAERLRENAPATGNAEKPSLLGRIIAWLKVFCPFGRDEQARQAAALSSNG